MLAREIGVPERFVAQRAFGANQFSLYSTLSVPKRDGSERVIHAPKWPLANIQSKLKILLEELYRPSPRVMGFVKGRGIRENASLHVGKRVILNVDIKDYFSSIHVGRIRRRLMAAPYHLTVDVATTIAKLCTLDGILPTGAPTSPVISNIISSKLDADLTKIARINGCFYTRYADDISFSTNRKSLPTDLIASNGIRPLEIKLADPLLSVIRANGFEPNENKTRILTRTMRQEVCGVVCNVRLNPRREILREVRAIIHAWNKYGKEEAERVWSEKFNWRNALSLERSLRGKIEHIIHLRGDDDSSTANLVARFNNLQGRIYSDIEYQYTGDRRETIINSICLVESGDDESIEYKQGSGFIISGSRVVTNAHNVSRDGVLFPKISIIFPGDRQIEYEMTVISIDLQRDVAVLGMLHKEWNFKLEKLACALSFKEVSNGQIIYVGGFPNYMIGDDCVVLPGQVIGSSSYDGQKYFRVSQIIVKGNSGGPVFDDLGQVIGIATKGVDTHDVTNVGFNGCIPLHSIDRLIPM